MAHLLTFRKGWENEKLGAYLLSRISFVAQPTSSADDLGSDFFCTIFEIHEVSGKDALMPRISFAIQVKSSASDVSADNKIDYLMGLELPFFIGVVTQSPPEMRIYSAELLPLLFAEIGRPAKLSLIPVASFDPNKYYDGVGTEDIGLRCPLVTTLSVSDDRATLKPKVDALLRICARTHSNIATRVNEEHIYDVDGTGLHKIVAGPGSALHFRFNFLKRLGEVFYNLYFILGEAPPDETLTAEINAFESLYHELESKNHGPLPEFVSVPYKALKAKMSAHPVMR
ncbi:MAG: hypothetical protein WBC78_10205 [Candidatus Sulfotelmatobacter sp.]